MTYDIDRNGLKFHVVSFQIMKLLNHEFEFRTYYECVEVKFDVSPLQKFIYNRVLQHLYLTSWSPFLLNIKQMLKI